MNPELNSEINYIVIDKNTQMNSEPHIPNLENLKAEPERSSLRRKDENLNGATFKKPFSQISSNCSPECELKGVLHSLSL